MTITKVYCDHCGKVLDPMHDYIKHEMDIKFNTIRVDLCEKCVDTLEKEVKEFCKRSDTK
jgi:methionyl-tRNA synthetase